MADSSDSVSVDMEGVSLGGKVPAFSRILILVENIRALVFRFLLPIRLCF